MALNDDLTPPPNSVFPIDMPRGGEGSHWGAWYQVAPVGATPEIALRNDFQQHCADRYAAGDTIEIQSLDKTWMMRVLVRAKRHASVDVAKLWEWREEPVVLSAGGMRVVFGSRSWRIEMVANSEAVRDGYASRSEASAVMLSLTNPLPAKGTKAAA